MKPGARRSVTISVRIPRDIAGRRCTAGAVSPANALRARDVARTRSAGVAGAITPAVTG